MSAESVPCVKRKTFENHRTIWIIGFLRKQCQKHIIFQYSYKIFCKYDNYVIITCLLEFLFNCYIRISFSFSIYVFGFLPFAMFSIISSRIMIESIIHWEYQKKISIHDNFSLEKSITSLIFTTYCFALSLEDMGSIACILVEDRSQICSKNPEEWIIYGAASMTHRSSLVAYYYCYRWFSELCAASW